MDAHNAPRLGSIYKMTLRDYRVTALDIHLSHISTKDLIEELRGRDYRVIHRDRLKTVAAQKTITSRELEVLPKRHVEGIIRNDLSRQIGHFLSSRFGVEELPDNGFVDYRMTIMVIGPQISNYLDYPHITPPSRDFD